MHSFSGEFEHLANLREVLLSWPAPKAAASCDSAAQGMSKRLKVRNVEGGSWGMSMQFEGYESPEKARALTGMELLVPPEQASPLREGEWYIADLVDMDLMLDGAAVARVRAVLEGAADPLLECALPDGGSALVPFRNEFIGAVDLSGRSMQLLHGWILE